MIVLNLNPKYHFQINLKLSLIYSLLYNDLNLYTLKFK